MNTNLIVVFIGLLAVFSTLLLYFCRSQSAAKTQASQRQLEQLMAEIPGVVFQYQIKPDQSASISYLSPGIKTLCGIDPQTFDSSVRCVIECIHPDDRAEVLSVIRLAASRLEAWHQEFRIIHATDKTERWVLARAKPETTRQNAVCYHGYIHDITHERHVHTKLKSQELKLNLALDAVQEGIWEYNHELAEVHCDERIQTMLGYSKKQGRLSKTQMMTLIHPQDLTDLLQSMQRTVLNPGHVQIDYSFRAKTASEEWVWIQARGRVIEWNELLQPVRSMGLLRNISTQIADSQLRDALLNRSVACITLVTKDRQLIEANERFKAMFLSPGRNLNQFNFRSEIHIDDDHWVEFGKKYEILRQQDQVRFEFPMKDRWGIVHWFDMHGVLREPGNPDSDVIWTWFDVSARRAADLALSLERLRLHTLLQHFPGGVLIVDTNNSIVFLNNLAVQLLSISTGTQEIEGTNYTRLPDISDLQTYDWLEKAKQSAQNNDHKRFEVQSNNGQHLEIEYLDIHGSEGNLGAVWFIRDITQRIKEAQQLRELADTDSLTGLPNRRRFLQGIEHLFLNPPSEQSDPSYLLMLDIDHFKHLNDSHGHAAGDKVLAHVAQLIRQCLRRDDLPARLGGEEFAILLPGTNAATAYALAETIRQQIFYSELQIDQKKLSITISIGLSQLDSHDIYQSMNRADQALYAAKAQGRNRTVVWQNDRQTA